jgi:hypothetical protein
MAATLDKDTVVKHSFWILTGCYVVLVLACLAVLATNVGDTVRKEEEELKKAQDLVKGITNPKNDEFLRAYGERDKLVDSKKGKVWNAAWDTQKDMMTWPRKLESQFRKYKYFGEPIDLYDRGSFAQEYASQLEDVHQVVQPVNPNGEGVVQFKGDWQEVLQLDRRFDKPSKDDIWLAQEELWVKREMLRIIRDANQSVARFREVTQESSSVQDHKEGKAGPAADKDAKAAAKPESAPADKAAKETKPAPAKPKSDPNHKIFRNPYWEFDLTLVGPDKGKYSLRGKLTNIGKRKQPLDVKFKVFLQDTRRVEDPSSMPVSLAGLPLAVGESKEINEAVQEQKTIEGLFGVEQVLTWKTAAVKRLDDLRLMYPSSRTASRTLKPARFLVAAPTESADAAAADAAAPATPGGERGGLGGPGGAAMPVTTTLNGLDINRYTDVGDQVRHMPVAMVAVVDEEHLPELLAAFVNSKLRIQITQYHWQHCREHMNPSNMEETPPYAPGGGTRERTAIPGPMSSGPTRSGQGTIAGQRYGVNNPALLKGGPGGGERSGRMPGPPPSGRMSGPGPIGPQRPYGPSSGPFNRGPTSPGALSEEEDEQEDLNLLEVAVYGLASLYERYPPALKAPEQPATPEEKPAASPTGGN